MKSFLGRGLALAMSVFLMGCATEPSTILKMFNLESDTSITTGSRQRAITNTRVGSDSLPGQVNPERIVCAEPSPDVAVALANSFGVGVSVLGQGSGSLAASNAEGVIQLAERTITVQLLRDQLYRACEAFSNGAISGTTYSLVMSRINDTMVTLLLGETAGGAFGRELGAIGGTASADAQASLQGLRDDLSKTQEAATELAKADKKVEDKQAVYDGKKAVAANDPSDATKKQDAKDAKAELDLAKKERKATAALLTNRASTSVSTMDQVESTAAGDITNSRPDAQTAKTLAKMQNAFLKDDNAKALVAACVVEMGSQNADPDVEKAQNNLSQERRTFELNILEKQKTIYEDILKYWRYLQRLATDNPKNKEFNDRASKVLETLISLDKRLNASALTKYCEKRLMPTVIEANAYRVQTERLIANRRIDVEISRLTNQRLEKVTELMKSCDKASDADAKKRCDKAFDSLPATMTLGPGLASVTLPKSIQVEQLPKPFQ